MRRGNVGIYLAVFYVFVVCGGPAGAMLLSEEADFTTLILSVVKSQGDEVEEKPKTINYTVTCNASKIKVDGVLNEEAWAKATIIKLPYEYLPGDNTPAPVETDCLVTYDNNNFYVAFRCFDPKPSNVRAHLMDRDTIETFILDDHIGFLIDTFNDERRAFQFRANPLGVQADAILSELEGYEDFSWDAIWASAGKITEEGYVVEIAIPFNQLRFPRGGEKLTWGFEAFRSYPRNVRHRISSKYTDRNKNCILCQANKISGFEGITSGRNIEFDPTLTASRTDRRDDLPGGPMVAGKVDIEPGITARWGVSPNLILNGTVNPDFSQVEADVAQLEVNTRFALYYPEKRPFFLEGADFFLTPLEAVFTRTVADPLWGVKITGKLGRNAVGVFSASDRINNLLLPANQWSSSTSLDQDVVSGVFRYRRDVGEGSTLGVLYTGRKAEDYYSHLFGVDGFFRLSRSNTLSFQYLRSETDYPDEIAGYYDQIEEAFSGNAVFVEFLHNSRNWLFLGQYRDLSPGFRADYGFIPRVDIRQTELIIQRKIWGKADGWFNQINVGIVGERIEDHNGTLTDQIIDAYMAYSGPMQTNFDFEVMRKKEFFGGITYDFNLIHTDFDIQPAGGIKITFCGSLGGTIDYKNSRQASVVDLNPGVEFSLGRHFNLKFDHLFQRLSLEQGEIYRANLIQTGVIYNFNVRTFARAIIQYEHINRNTALYIYPVEPKEDNIFTQFLFSYKINPQTVLFLGYSDNYLGFRGLDLTQTNRTFFFKIGYAWVI